MKIPELLVPAGNFEKLRIALHYGADALYMGLSEFSLRAKADNFTTEELREASKLIHRANRKLYVTINIFPHCSDMSIIRDHLIFLRQISPDAVILSDVGVFETACATLPGIPIHISTQANVTNDAAAGFWQRMGAKRIVLSRELTIDEIKKIRDKVTLELECFIHGALCLSYSGRCYISSFLAQRSANRGECTNSCRWNYTLMEEKRPGEYLPVYENDRGTYVMSPRDLCMIEHLDKLAYAGIDSFKIEGRMKGINYLAGVTKTYREAINSLADQSYHVKQTWREELSMFSNRGYTTGMYLCSHPNGDYNHDEPTAYRPGHELVGVVRSVRNGQAIVSLRNSLKIGDAIEYLSPDLGIQKTTVTEMHDERGAPTASGRNEDTVMIFVKPGIRENDIIRRSLSR